ncbi:tyrosine-type recombinase/integrase [Vibrio parahaemolyticus]
MYLFRNRNATYYCRIYIPLPLRNRGFPNEIRFSLGTTDRQQAIDRNLVLSLKARAIIKSVLPSDTPESFKKRLSSIVEAVKERDFMLEEKGLQQHKPKVVKAKRDSDFKQKNEELLKDFVYTKRAEGIKNRSVQQLEARIRHFLAGIGLSTIKVTSKDALSYRDKLLSEGRSHKTNVEYLAAVKQFYNWMELRGECKTRPFEKIKIGPRKKAPYQDRSRWSHEQLLRLFSHNKFTRPYDLNFASQTRQTKLEDYWIPIVLLHTGARIGEISQLRTKDVYREKGLWVISINDDGEYMSVKSRSSVRLIPIHPRLIELGFTNYCEARRSSGAEQLFDLRPIGVDLDWGKQFAKRFERVLTETGFVGKNRPTLHSFRHTFIDELQQKGVPENVVAELVGHAKKRMTYGRYGKNLSIDLLYKALNEIVLDLGNLGRI